MLETKQFRDGMAMLSGAVSVITTDGEAGRFGFTATAVSSVTDEPPTLLVCMNRQSFANSNFKQNGVLCVNVLQGHHQGISWDFANRELSSDQRFSRHDWRTLETGSPVLNGALVSFDCVINDRQEVGTHTVFFCEVKAVQTQSGGSGLVYFNRAYHTVADAAVAQAS